MWDANTTCPCERQTPKVHQLQPFQAVDWWGTQAWDIDATPDDGTAAGGVLREGVVDWGDDGRPSGVRAKIFSSTLMVPTRGFFDDVTRMMKGDWYTGRGSRQRALWMGSFCNNFKVATHGRAWAIQRCTTCWELSMVVASCVSAPPSRTATQTFLSGSSVRLAQHLTERYGRRTARYTVRDHCDGQSLASPGRVDGRPEEVIPNVVNVVQHHREDTEL